jgi:hypothetical protein
MEKKRKSSVGSKFFVHRRILSVVQRAEVFSNRMSYVVLRGRCCDIIVLNAQAQTLERGDDSKHIFYEELERGFEHFPK